MHNKIATLHNLATVYLRLTMHFFHPIQQCAQHIYYTALPLSPTSSHLQNFCLQNVTDGQLSHVTAFIGAPETWGLLLRTIDIRPRQLTCITTFGQEIIAACGNIVNIYDAVCYVQIPKESGHSRGRERGSGSGSGGSYRLPVATGSRYGCE